jgi:hypothetical protein
LGKVESSIALRGTFLNLPEGIAIIFKDRKSGVVKMDRWIFWPAFASLGIVFILTLICGLPGPASFIMALVSVPGCAIASIVFLAMALISTVKKRPRRAASVLLALIAPVLLWWPINWGADCVHLGITVGFGAGQAGHPSSSDGSGFAVYDWSVGFAGGPNRFLIHDETDQIALPMAQHTQPSVSENVRFLSGLPRQTRQD